MLPILRQTRTGFFIAMVGLLCLSVMSPMLTVASSDLLAGDDAVVTNGTTLRSDVGSTAEVIAEVGPETPVSIIEGPLTVADGTLWYLVTVRDLIGFLPASSVDAATSTADATSTAETTDTEPTENAPEAPALPWREPVDFGVANADVVCRDAASTGGTEIVVVLNGRTIEITGEESWAEGIAWTPVNCAGVGGFISSDYITVEEQTEEVVEQNPVETSETGTTTENAVNTAPLEELEGLETENATEPNEDGAVVDEVPLPPWATPIGFAVAADSVVCRGAPSLNANEIVVLAVDQTVEVTGEAIWAEGMSWTPINCGEAGGFVSSELLATDTASEVVEEPTEEALNAEEIVEDVNENVEAAVTADSTGTADPDGTTEQDTELSAVAKNEVTTENVDTETPAADEVNDLVEDVTDSVESIEQDADQAAEDVTDTVETVEQDADQAAEDVTDSVDTLDEDADQAAEDVTDSVDTNARTDDEELEEIAENVTRVADIEELATEDLAVTVAEAPSASPVEDWQILGTAQVRGANDAGLACRSSASSSASVLTVMPEGMTVMVLSEPDANGWMSIVCADQVGFATAELLWSGGAESPLDLDFSGIAIVTGTGGGGLNCRSAASISASVIAWFPEGSAVNARGGEMWNWVPVVCGGQNGWVYADFLSASGASVDTGNRSESSAGNSDDTNGSSEGGTSSGTVVVTGTSGANLNCRTGAGTNHSIITSVPEGSTLNVRGAASGGWQAVTCAGMNGFVSTMYITAGSGSGDSSGSMAPRFDWDLDFDLTPQEREPEPAGFGNGDHARTTANLNLRYDPSRSAGVATYAPAGTVVEITGSHAGNGYYPVNWDGLTGYMHGDYLAKTDQAPSERGGSGRPDFDIDIGSAISGGGGSATGNAIVDYAMGYVGYPYVWATAGPYSFDCSGFTNWVIKNVVGPDIGRGLWTQVSAGTPVSRANLQPGDLVFHQNTYKAGLSHVGIYIGDNKMVNALNENAGVVVTDITSDYWESRWYSAVRIN